jgi:DNA-binding NarL/FixJ family response regulator
LRVYRGTGAQADYAVLVFPTSEQGDHGSLTSAERQVAELLLTGLSNEGIAARRGTSVRTASNQIQSIYKKLRVNSRVELAAVMAGANAK